ncbi:MAG TPA: tyrosine-type recombinase/integrase [Verrucomicrobiae bacterium]|nr:tyrosine-type recombinase/integrase [Verrucomicrobiae bacterium]
MKQKFWLCKRKNVFFSFDSETRRRESLHTGDKEEAQRILRAKNDAATQPAINISIAKAYLVGTDAKLVQRTWAFVIQEYCAVKKDSTRDRRERAVKSKAFNIIRNKRLVETTAEDFHAVLKSSGVFTCHILRGLHNLALGMGWILAPIIPPKLWPKYEKKPKRAVTFEEHQKIVQAENENTERKAYYELLWEIGAAQTDGANLTTANIDWNDRLLSYRRKKTGELCMMEIGSRLEAILKSLPSQGALFPKISELEDKDRAAEFRRRCRLLGIDGISLHSYRYAWAWRAKQAGMPERFAQSGLGHGSLAVHREYSRDGVAICPSLENYENKIVPLNTVKAVSSVHQQPAQAAI